MDLRERETSICGSTYSCVYRLIPVCAGRGIELTTLWYRDESPADRATGRALARCAEMPAVFRRQPRLRGSGEHVCPETEGVWSGLESWAQTPGVRGRPEQGGGPQRMPDTPWRSSRGPPGARCPARGAGLKGQGCLLLGRPVLPGLSCVRDPATPTGTSQVHDLALGVGV